MSYITLYKSKVAVKNLDRALKKFLMVNCLNEENTIELTHDSRTLLTNRAGELSPETLKLIVASAKENLFKATMHVMPNELLLTTLENKLRDLLYNLPKEKFQDLIPALIENAKAIDGEWEMSSNISYMLQHQYTWDNGRKVKALARNMLQHDTCTPSIALELIRRYPTLTSCVATHDKFDEWLDKKELKLIEGETYEDRKPVAAEL